MSEAARWTRATEGDGVGVRAVADGTLLTIEQFDSRFLAVRYGRFEQLSATLRVGFEAEPARVQAPVTASLLRAHVFTLGARAGIDRAGGLAVVAEAEGPLPDGCLPDGALTPWLMRTQVVANAMLAIVSVAEQTGEALSHDAVARLFEARQ